jgi:hypothetical protein
MQEKGRQDDTGRGERLFAPPRRRECEEWCPGREKSNIKSKSGAVRRAHVGEERLHGQLQRMREMVPGTPKMELKTRERRCARGRCGNGAKSAKNGDKKTRAVLRAACAWECKRPTWGNARKEAP